MGLCSRYLTVSTVVFPTNMDNNVKIHYSWTHLLLLLLCKICIHTPWSQSFVHKSPEQGAVETITTLGAGQSLQRKWVCFNDGHATTHHHRKQLWAEFDSNEARELRYCYEVRLFCKWEATAEGIWKREASDVLLEEGLAHAGSDWWWGYYHTVSNSPFKDLCFIHCNNLQTKWFITLVFHCEIQVFLWEHCIKKPLSTS